MYKQPNLLGREREREMERERGMRLGNLTHSVKAIAG